MNRYDFKCQKCGLIKEYRYSMADVPDFRKCPKCKNWMERQIGSGLGVIFKGSGFHVNDYPKEKTTIKLGNAWKDREKRKIENEEKRRNEKKKKKEEEPLK